MPQQVTETDPWLALGRLEEIPPRGARRVEIEGESIAVFRTADDRVFALRNRCPHKGGPLSEGIVFGHLVACPLHNWRIDLESGEAVAPDQGCTRTYPVRVEDGVIYLSLV